MGVCPLKGSATVTSWILNLTQPGREKVAGKSGGRGKAHGCQHCEYMLKADRVSMTGIPNDCTDIPKGCLAKLRIPKPLLDLHAVKLAREGVAAKEVGLRMVSGDGTERGKGAGRGWVSGDRGLDPYHCVFLHLIWLLQHSLSHQGGSQRNLRLLRCHRGYARGNLRLLRLNGATAAALLRHFPKGPRLGPITIKDLQNKHK